MGDNLKLEDIIGMNKSQLDGVLKKDLVAILSASSNQDLTSPTNVLEVLDQKLKIMEKNIIDNLITENKKLSDKLEDLEYVNDKLASRVATLERNHWQNAQYQRRNNIEIVGIPTSVEDNNLEETVCSIFKAIDVIVKPEEVEACHRLPYSRKEDKSNPKRSIIKLVNRKKCEQALANRKKLKDVDMTDLKFEVDTRIFLNDSLCPYYRGIYGKCKSLYREKLR